MKNTMPLVFLALVAGVVLGATIRPAQANNDDRATRALESIAHSLQQCPR